MRGFGWGIQLCLLLPFYFSQQIAFGWWVHDGKTGYDSIFEHGEDSGIKERGGATKEKKIKWTATRPKTSHSSTLSFPLFLLTLAFFS